MKRNNAFVEMLLHHLEEIDAGQLGDEIDSLALNIGGLVCDANINLSEKKQDQIIAALRAGMREIVREYKPECFAMLERASASCQTPDTDPASSFAVLWPNRSFG